MFKERIKTHHSAMSEGKDYMLGMRPVNTVLSTANIDDKQNSVIYIHVPFCKKICSFCNMRRSLQLPTQDYASIIVKEIQAYAKLSYIKTTVFDAVYFGGGTPTTLSAEELCSIVYALKENFAFTDNAEFTIETTVTELTEEKIEKLIAAGINRFSVGVQTFDNKGREKMGRIGSGEAAFKHLCQLKAYENVIVSMDLIYNYSGQTMESLYNDLDKIVELDLDGFSMYSLIDMKETSIDKAQDKKNDDRMFFTIADYMENKGYEFLELTKMVKKDQYKYIVNRHKGANTLPLGAGAGGTVNHLAIMNPINLEEYKAIVETFSKRIGMLFKPEYDEIVRFKGAIQMCKLPKEDNYRNLNEYQKFKQELLVNKMIVKKEDNYYLTKKGIFWGNTISRKLSEML